MLGFPGKSRNRYDFLTKIKLTNLARKMIYREQFMYDILSDFRLPQGNLPLKSAPLYTENRRENAVVNSMDKSPFIYYHSYSLGHGYYNC